MHKKSNGKDEKNKNPIKRIVLFSAAGCLFYYLMLMLFSLVAMKKGLNASYYIPVGFALGAFSSLLCGFSVVRPLKQKGAFYGLITGVFQAIMISAVLFAANKGSVGIKTLILAAIVSFFAAVGGIAAVNLKIKKKY